MLQRSENNVVAFGFVGEDFASLSANSVAHHFRESFTFHNRILASLKYAHNAAPDLPIRARPSAPHRVGATAEIQRDASRGQIVVSGLRCESSLEILAVTLFKLVGQRRLDGITDMRNESTDGITRLVIQLRRGASAHPVLDAIDEHMPSDEAEIDVDPRTWETRT